MPGIFISHSSKDKEIATRVAIDLASRGFPVWFDTWEMGIGDSLFDKIYKGIDASSCLIVLLSSSSVESNWVKKELNGALARENELGRKFVLPVLVSECKAPLSLADRIYIDFSRSYLENLEKLCAELERLEAGNATIDPDKALLPLVFSRLIHLDDVVLERLVTKLEHGVQNCNFHKEQIVLAPNKTYSTLRQRMFARKENLEDDPYFSRDFQRSFNQLYQNVLDLERNLTDGIVALLNLEKIPYGALYWFGKITRVKILQLLFMAQNPDGETLEAPAEIRESSLASEKPAAEFFNVKGVLPCHVGPRDGDSLLFAPGAYSVWIDSESAAGKYLKEVICDPLEPLDDGEIYGKFLVPQILFSCLQTKEEIPDFKFNRWLIGIR